MSSNMHQTLGLLTSLCFLLEKNYLTHNVGLVKKLVYNKLTVIYVVKR